MVTILKNMTNILTALGEIYVFRKGQNKQVWAALFMMVCPFRVACPSFSFQALANDLIIDEY
jgi:hypothetical protein